MSGFIVGIFRGLLKLAAGLIVLACVTTGVAILRAWLPGGDPILAATIGGLLGLLAGLVVVAIFLGLQFLAVRINENLESVVAKLDEVNASIRLLHEPLGRGPVEGRAPSVRSPRVEPRL